MKLDFINFIPAAPEEKYLGLALIQVDDVRYIYKAVRTKNGGIFVGAPQVKSGEDWLDAFKFGFAADEILPFVRKHVMAALGTQSSSASSNSETVPF